MSTEHNTPSPGPAAPMRRLERTATLSRRAFLKGGGMTALGVAVIPATALLTPTRDALAQSFQALAPETGKTLLVMARDIFPHDRISDRYYMQAVEPYDKAAAGDPKLKALLDEGARGLDALARQRFGKPYAEVASEAERVGLLHAIETGAFFQKVKGDLVTGLYNNKAVWPLLGYEGSSWQKGGYLHRGFDDIDWL